MTNKKPYFSAKTVLAYPNGYPKAEVVCCSCKQVFSTFNPGQSGLCSCGNIECDISETHIRVLDCFCKGYRYQENGKTINGVELTWDMCE